MIIILLSCTVEAAIWHAVPEDPQVFFQKASITLKNCKVSCHSKYFHVSLKNHQHFSVTAFSVIHKDIHPFKWKLIPVPLLADLLHCQV